jgi:hypothetical protein
MFDRIGPFLVRLKLRRKRTSRPIDIAASTTILTAILAIILTVATRFPQLRSVPALQLSLPDAVILFAALIIMYLYRFRNEVRDDTKAILERLQGADFRVFTSSDEQVLYIASKINGATQSVCDISWVDYWGAHRTSPERASADRAFDDAVMRFAAHKPYREIFVFDSVETPNREVRLEKLKKRTVDANNGYYCAYFPETDLPRFQFIIIDDEVVLHTFDGESSDARCSIRHPEFARLFRAYYSRLWRAAVPLKDDGGRRPALDKFLDGEIPNRRNARRTGRRTASLPIRDIQSPGPRGSIDN